MAEPESDLDPVEQDLRRLQAMIDQSFTAQQLTDLRERLTGNEARFERLRAFLLTNGDEPAPGFRSYRKEA